MEFTNLSDYNRHMESLEADGGTDFMMPLYHILQIVKKGEVKSLLVMFLTDGCDNNEAGSIKIADKIKEEIENR